jgi:hypothetical protein
MRRSDGSNSINRSFFSGRVGRALVLVAIIIAVYGVCRALMHLVGWLEQRQRPNVAYIADADTKWMMIHAAAAAACASNGKASRRIVLPKPKTQSCASACSKNVTDGGAMCDKAASVGLGDLDRRNNARPIEVDCNDPVGDGDEVLSRSIGGPESSARFTYCCCFR